MTSRTSKSLQGLRARHTEHENSVALVGDGDNLVTANPCCLPHTPTLRVGKGLASHRHSLVISPAHPQEAHIMAVTMVQTTLLRNSIPHFHARAWCSLIPQTWL